MRERRVCDRIAFTLEEAVQFFAVNREDTLVCRLWTGALKEVNCLEDAMSFFSQGKVETFHEVPGIAGVNPKCLDRLLK